MIKNQYSTCNRLKKINLIKEIILKLSIKFIINLPFKMVFNVLIQYKFLFIFILYKARLMVTFGNKNAKKNLNTFNIFEAVESWPDVSILINNSTNDQIMSKKAATLKIINKTIKLIISDLKMKDVR